MSETAAEQFGDVEQQEHRVAESGAVVVELIEYSRRHAELETSQDGGDVESEQVVSLAPATSSATILEFPAPPALDHIEDNDPVVAAQSSSEIDTSSIHSIGARPTSNVGRLELTLGRVA